MIRISFDENKPLQEDAKSNIHDMSVVEAVPPSDILDDSNSSNILNIFFDIKSGTKEDKRLALKIDFFILTFGCLDVRCFLAYLYLQSLLSLLPNHASIFKPIPSADKQREIVRIYGAKLFFGQCSS
ncbi:Piso0_002878 [Millerozyma farinosa CBS 7064]|uniref:Piso0_002878 protein n=1 Tax=Pichia sorbitophila (strain ATCC MYA-4447 / BCRC 22081 / CBS 7064 / NBRC 10061 / NRRL Y-12695) TaxID=559304 RepID=G8YDR9_PICSO|nr:Piso0_002878 [Millerozyma farinosa CBS 7064]